MMPGHLPRAVAWLATSLAVLALVQATTARPASADPPRPTNHRSRVIAVDPPAPPGVSVEIQGGDAFVVMTVDRGHEVVVPDYGASDTDRPYLHFQDDGTVRMNESSAAASANESRFGTRDPGFDPDGEPRWRTVSTTGSHAWHDHRIHLMVPDHLAVVDERGRVDLGGEDGTWEIPLEVDGVATTVTGELIRVDAPAAWPWYAAVVLIGAAVLVVAMSVTAVGRGIVGLALLVAGLASGYVAATELANAPDGSGASSVPIILASASVLGALMPIGSGIGGDRRPMLARTGTALSAAALTWWGATRLAVFSNSILPSQLGSLDRTVTALALGIGAVVAVVLMWRPSLVADTATGTPAQGSTYGKG